MYDIEEVNQQNFYTKEQLVHLVNEEEFCTGTEIDKSTEFIFDALTKYCFFAGILKETDAKEHFYPKGFFIIEKSRRESIQVKSGFESVNELIIESVKGCSLSAEGVKESVIYSVMHQAPRGEPLFLYDDFECECAEIGLAPLKDISNIQGENIKLGKPKIIDSLDLERLQKENALMKCEKEEHLKYMHPKFRYLVATHYELVQAKQKNELGGYAKALNKARENTGTPNTSRSDFKRLESIITPLNI